MDAMDFVLRFSDLERQYSQDQHQFEFYSFIVATLSLEDPIKFKRLEQEFRRIEPNVVALRAIQDHYTSEECPF